MDWFLWVFLVFVAVLLTFVGIEIHHEISYQIPEENAQCDSFGGHILHLSHDRVCLTKDGRIITAY